MQMKRTPARMARLVAQWRESGDSQANFARRHRVPTWTFWYWCRKLANATTTVAEPRTAPAFVPVHLTPDPPAPVLEIVFSGGERVQIRSGASIELVQATVTALRGTC